MADMRYGKKVVSLSTSHGHVEYVVGLISTINSFRSHDCRDTRIHTVSSKANLAA
jgi:hypothetical protein